MDLNSEKQRPQKVEVVNGSTNPTKVEVQNFPHYSMSIGTNILRVELSSMRPLQGQYFLQTNFVLGLSSDGQYIVFPYQNRLLYLSSNQRTSFLASVKSDFATIASGVTSLTLHYTEMNSSGVVTAVTYNLKD